MSSLQPTDTHLETSRQPARRSAATRPHLNPVICLTLSWMTLQLAGCGSFNVTGISDESDGAPTHGIDVADISNAVPKAEPRSEYGNPDSYVVEGRRYHVMDSSHGYVEQGIASWYGTKFHNRRTSSGEPYNMYAMTAAHKSLPLPTYVEVTNLDNGATAIVKVNDRGPFRRNRLIDLSYAAATKLGIIDTGTAPVEVRAIDPRQYAERGTQKLNAQKPAKPQPYGLYLQIGSFINRNNAEQLRNNVGSLTSGEVHIIPVQNQDQTYYRVRVGPIANVNGADRLSEKLTEHGIGNAHLIVD